MSRLSRQPHPWLADHVVFFGYRWAAWLVTGALIFQQQGRAGLVAFAPLLLVTFCVNLLATLVAQPYLRAARRNPAIMLIDVVYAVAVLLMSGGWQGPFVVYASSSLVFPGLLYSWRGGIMAGLAFVTLDLATNSFVGHPPDVIAAQESGWTLLATMMVAPPLFGALFPPLLEGLRRVVARERHQKSRHATLVEPRSSRESASDIVERIAARGLDANRRADRVVEPAAQTTRTAAVRMAEQGVDDTRQIIFAPFPSPDADLPAALDILATRVSEHSGIATRVTLLGRPRVMNRALRSVLVRLAQEALLNVQQHAHAEAIELTLRYDASSVALMIQDNGVGLLDGTYERPGLHALRAMHYRLAELGGRLDVFETESSGVTVRATVPLE